MGITNGLVKYLGGELAEAGGKGASKVASSKLTNLLSKAVDKAGVKTISTLSKVGDQLPAVAQKADDLIMENGKPKVFYHGSPKTDIDVLDLSNAGKNTGSGEKALYFTDTYPAAEEFSYERLPSNSMFIEKRGKKGKVYERNLKNSNLVDLGNLTDDQIDELFDYANGLAKYDGKEKFVKNLKDFRSAGNDQLIKSQLDLEALAKSPYDGFVAKMYPGENDAREYAIFDPTRAVKTNNTELDVDVTKALKNTMDKYGASDGGGKIPEASSEATNDDMMTLYRGLPQKYDPKLTPPIDRLADDFYDSAKMYATDGELEEAMYDWLKEQGVDLDDLTDQDYIKIHDAMDDVLEKNGLTSVLYSGGRQGVNPEYLIVPKDNELYAGDNAWKAIDDAVAEIGKYDVSHSWNAGNVPSRYLKFFDDQIRIANHSNDYSHPYNVQYSNDDLIRGKITPAQVKNDIVWEARNAIGNGVIQDAFDNRYGDLALDILGDVNLPEGLISFSKGDNTLTVVGQKPLKITDDTTAEDVEEYLVENLKKIKF